MDVTSTHHHLTTIKTKRVLTMANKDCSKLNSGIDDIRKLVFFSTDESYSSIVSAIVEYRYSSISDGDAVVECVVKSAPGKRPRVYLTIENELIGHAQEIADWIAGTRFESEDAFFASCCVSVNSVGFVETSEDISVGWKSNIPEPPPAVFRSIEEDNEFLAKLREKPALKQPRPSRPGQTEPKT